MDTAALTAFGIMFAIGLALGAWRSPAIWLHNHRQRKAMRDRQARFDAFRLELRQQMLDAYDVPQELRDAWRAIDEGDRPCR